MAAVTDAIKASWPAPNYVNPDNLDAVVLGVTIPILIVTATFLCLRFYGKALMRQRLGSDDWVMLAATMFAIPVSIMPLVDTNLGLGRHLWDIKAEWYAVYWKLSYAADLMFPSACSLNKISLLLTYLRLFPSSSNKMFCYIMIAFITTFTVACLFLSLFQCHPIKSYWDLTVKQVCINMQATLVTMAAFNSFSDCLVYLWPVKPLWSLHLPLKQRLGLIFLFSVGLIVCVAGVVRAYYLYAFFRSYDVYWNGVPIWLCMVLEMDVGIICGCLSGVKPVMSYFFPTVFRSTYRQRTGPTKSSYGPRTGPSAHRDSFAFEQLSSNKTRDKTHVEQLEADEILRVDDGKKGSFAWARSEGTMGIVPHVPANRIAVNQEITQEISVVDDGAPGTMTPRSDVHNKISDSGSEEWIFKDDSTKA